MAAGQRGQRIERIKSAVSSHRGFANPNRFEIYVTPPRFLVGRYRGDIQVLCDSIELPGQQLATVEHFVSAKAIKKPTNYINDDVNMTISITNDFYPWDFFDDWIKGIIKRDTNQHKYGVRFKEDYVSDLDIYTIGSDRGVTSRHIRLINTYPTTLGSISLGNQNENLITQVPITFAYDDWHDDRNSPNTFSGRSRGGSFGLVDRSGEVVREVVRPVRS